MKGGVYRMLTLKRKASPKGYRVSLDTSPDLSLKEEFRPPYTKRNCPM